MSWLAISPPLADQIPHNAPPVAQMAVAMDRAGRRTLLERGSILIEAGVEPVRRPEMLLDIAWTHPWRGRLSIYLVPGGSLALVIAKGDALTHAVLPVAGGDVKKQMRVTWRWDCATGKGSFWSEQPGQSVMPVWVEVDAPPPLACLPLLLAAKQMTPAFVGPSVDLLAISDELEPVGPVPGLAGGTLVDTPHGPRRADSLGRGDLVSVPGAGAVPILAAIARNVPARGDFAPVRIAAPRFGLMQDVIVAAGQRIVIAGSAVEYLFGRERVLVPARHLIGEGIGRWEAPRRTVTWVQFLLPRQESIQAGGAVLESLHVGRMRRVPRLQEASLLAGYPRASMPDHPVAAWPVLNAFEAVTLAAYRAA